MGPQCKQIFLLFWALALTCQGVLLTYAHAHQGCGHSLVADEAKRWSQLHRQHGQLLQARMSSAAASISALEGADPEQQQLSSSGPTPRLLAATQTVPIRIWVEYQGIDSLSADGKQHLFDTVNIAKGVFAKYYKVRRPPSGRLTVRPFCRIWDSANYCNQHQPDFLTGWGGSDNTCGSARINGSHIASYTQCTLGGGRCEKYPGGTGEFTDYYLYITAIQDEHCASGAVAWALPCLYDDSTNRPLLGSANICPQALMNADPDAAVAVLVHELTHALGFTDDMFDKFVDADGQPIPENQVVQAYVDAYGRQTSMIITPTVAKETQRQFACDRVPGAALENEGGQGSAMAHWEYRWFQGELMVATNLFAVYGKPATLSRITLAFMQDTGWYDVDWEQAGFLDWGWQAGCDFVAKTCNDFAAANPGQRYFCTRDEYAQDVNTVCTFDGLARAKCEDAQFADGCTMKVALGTSPNCLFRQYSSSAGDKFGWQNGLSSRCIPVTWLMNTFTYQFPDSSYKDGWRDSMCYKSSCTADGQLQLNILGSNVSCPSGQTVDLAQALPNQFRRGSIGPCPDNKAMCQLLSCGESCTVGGLCHEGKCYCNLQFFGPDCAKKLTPDGNYTNYVPVVDDGQPAGAAFDNGYLMLSVRLESSQEALYLSLDKFKSAVAQLAGVTTSRVAVLSFLTDAPASSLFGRRLAHSSSSSRDDNAGWEVVQVEGTTASARADADSSSSQRRLQQLRSGQLEVYSRIATMNAADAETISGRINNATRQEEFAKSLDAAGLKLVPGSISVRNTDDVSGNDRGTFGIPGINMSDPNTRRIIIIVAASVGAGLVVMLIAWAVTCCVRRNRRRTQSGHPSRQQFLTSGGRYNTTPGTTPSSSGHSGGATGPARQMFGSGGGSNNRPGGNGQLVNPFAGTTLNFGNQRGAGSPYAPQGSAFYTPPSAAATVPPGGYTVAGQTFRTAKEAEDYALALAMQRSLQQSGPPAHFLPHNSYGGSAGQQQGPTGYPGVSYGQQR